MTYDGQVLPNGELRRYSTGAIFLHWAIALLIVCNIVIGITMRDMEGVSKLSLVRVHESIGLSVLMLSVIRILWRIAHRPPALPPDMRTWERILARTVQTCLYILMFALPLTGWIVVSSSAMPSISLYNFIPWPWFPGVHDLPAATLAQVKGISVGTHVLLGQITGALIVLHLAGAIKHMVLRDGIAWRMLPLRILSRRR